MSNQTNPPKHRLLGLTDDQALSMYRCMLLARKLDERLHLLQRAGKINFHVSGIGQETAQAAAAFALGQEMDYYLPYYRDYAFVLAVGMTTKELMLFAFAKAEDPNSGGRQMTGHFGSKRLRIVTSSSPVGTQVPHAAGIALSMKMKRQERLTFVTFGEGASSQGEVHEAFNFAGLHRLPVIFMCENNQYSISIPARKQVSGSVTGRAAGYGFPGILVDGSDALEVYRVTKEAKERALRGEGPTLIEASMYRISPHSTSDDDMVYRSKEEVELNKKKDGILKLRSYLMDTGILNEELEQSYIEAIMNELNESTRYAEKAAYPKPEDVLLHVYDSKEPLPKPSGTMLDRQVHEAGEDRIPYYSPAVMRLAAANGLDIRTVKGSGLHGRVTRKDVLGHTRAHEAHPAPSANMQAKAASEAESSTSRPDKNHAHQTAAGKDTAAMLVEADVTNLVQLVRKHEEGFQRKEGAKLTYVPFYLKAVVNGLKAYPAMNAVWEAGSFKVKEEIHIMLASDTGGAAVMEHADGKSVAGFAIELRRDAVGKGRGDSLQTADRTGTFALQAADSAGALIAHPAIRHPHAAVLYIGPVTQRPVIKEDMIGGRYIVHLCLTLNQQAAGHAVGTAFLNSLKQTLEQYDANTLLY